NAGDSHYPTEDGTMLRNVLLMLAIGLLLAPLAWADDKEKAATAGQDKNMSGTWIPTDGMIAGQKMPDNHLAATKLILNDGKYTVVVGEDKEEGTYKIDTTKPGPHPLDIEPTMGPNKGKKMAGIVEMKGDTMRVCYNPNGMDRPKDFTST